MRLRRPDMDPRLAKTVVLGEEPERAVALLQIARGSRHELVDHARGAGAAQAYHAGHLPPGPPSPVSGPPEDYELYMTRTKRLVPGVW